MANLVYNFHSGGSSHHDASGSHHHHPVPSAGSFPHDSFHPPMYEDIPPVHGFHAGEGAAPSLFDDVIRFQLGHTRMI
ncbi:hypothetical protein PINS_up007239 [Pythium insidiosum]|nr:hypothetical protein PINS_up007239 [Pythium insidiosum]